MRSTYLILLFIFSLGHAKPMSFKDSVDELEIVRKKISLHATIDDKRRELKKLEDKFNTTMKEYEAESPEEGSKDEDQVNKLFFSLEPVFDMSKNKISKAECEKAEHRIRLEDRDMTKKNPNELSMQADEALAMLKLFCK